MMKSHALLSAVVLLAACSPTPQGEKVAQDAPAAAPVVNGEPDKVPAGSYTLDKTHSSAVFRVNHTGMSTYVGTFRDLDATLVIDPKAPEAAKLSASARLASLEVPAPPEGFLKELLGPTWLDASKGDAITFVSTKVERTGGNKARVTGDLTLRGVTKPAVMEVVYNGGYGGMAIYDPNARIGFSGKMVIKRSDFGMSYGIPAPGTVMGVGDEVDITFEAEFTGPPMPEAPASAN